MIEEQQHAGGHVVVTGVAGFIGSHLAEALVDRGHEVVGVDCFTPAYSPASKRRNLQRLLGHPAFRLVEGDLVTLALDAWLEGAEVVFHQAAQPGVRSSWGRDFAIYVHHNVLATQCLLEACARAGVPRLVAASSSSVYGDAPVHPTTEESITRPVSPYGVTKLASEHLCLAYGRPGVAALSVATLRYFTVYGPRQRPDMAMHRLVEAALTGSSFRLFGDGSQIRDFTFVSDVVRANLLASTVDLKPGTVMNVSGVGSVSMREVIELIADLARRLIGWQPEVDLRDGLREQIAWQRRRLRTYESVLPGAERL